MLSRSRVYRGLAALAAVLLVPGAGPATAQTSSSPTEGVAARPVRHLLLVNARIVAEPGRVIDAGSIELRDGRIVAVHRGAVPLAGAATRDLEGRTVFAGFIEAASRLGVPEEMRAGAIKPLPPGTPALQTSSDQPGARHWNRRVRPEWSVAERLDYQEDEAKRLRAMGFAAAYAVPEAGIVRGQGALLSLRQGALDKDVVLSRDLGQHFGFELAGGFSGEYPGSLMGAIALIRQSLYDARWFERNAPRQRVEENLALRALAPAARGAQPAVFQLDDELDVQRVDRMAREFGLDARLIGTGFEYRVLPALRRSGAPLVLPLTFPDAPLVEDADSALNTSLAELQHWEQAPSNPARVAAAGLRFGLTTRGLKDPEKSFWKNLRRAVQAGLGEDRALAALTVAPAEMLGQEDRLGRIAPGRLANLVVADAGLFRDESARIYEVWVEGERHELADLAAPDPLGRWALQWSDGRGPAEWTIEGKFDAPKLRIGEASVPTKRVDDRLIAFPPKRLFGEGEGEMRLSLTFEDDRLEGFRALADGRRFRVTGRRLAAAAEASKADDAPPPAPPIPEFAGYPAGEYGRRHLPEAPDVLLVRNATLWTNTEAGILRGADLLVRKGRIAAVGVGLEVPRDAVVIEAEGRHLTPGIIDAHSHTAVARNVNEPSHAVTTEVRVADVVDPTDIDLYRQLAGGVTTANLLHGSANPMGGQSAVIKLRWGADADGLLLQGAKPGVKFALGENVKQSGWGDAFVTRYPQTRMGVEQVMRDHLLAARDYAAARGEDPDGTRRDLRLDALAEILTGRRDIHVHSYRQDEILMFARLAEEFDLSVATFQHVLEGYKVADRIAALGAGASTFADWWGYKMEVIDAIPHNGALMTRAGVLTSFNSDSNEMARRLNMEAAKAMRYGGLDEQQALALVTSNPARQLNLADRIGALKTGMDADFVLWSDHPLSNFARAEQTWIDGRRYFDRAEDQAMQRYVAAERERLLAAAGVERAKALSLAGDAAEDASRDEGDEEPEKPDAAAPGGLHAFERHVHARGLYHSGADLSSCGINDHAH